MSAFSLEQEPFPQSPESDFYFSTPALEARLDVLVAALDGGNVLLVDDEGAGKSTMLRRYAATAAGATRIVQIRGSERCSAKSLLDEVVASLGLPPRAPAAAELRDADTLLELLERRSQTVAVIVDDADCLQHEALAQLLYLARRWHGYRVRFVIAGAPALGAGLDSLPESEGLAGPVARLHMPRFDEGQVADYLHMRLFRAGLSGDSPFAPDVVATVARESRGLIGAIDPVARRVLGQLGTGSREAAPARRWPFGLVALAGLWVLLAAAVPGPRTPMEKPAVRPLDGVFRSSITPASGMRREERGRSASADASDR